MRPPRWSMLLPLVLLASACATAPDPWEGANRKVYRFNERVDAAVLKPVATGYTRVVPQPVRQGVTNVLGNIRDVWSSANKLLQGKVGEGLAMGTRVLVNTTVGVAGVFDPATGMGLVRRQEDFGQTLGHWGVGSGPYLVLPLLGPSTLRDAPALLVDRIAAPSALASSSGTETAITVVEAVDTRAGLLGATELLDDVALDPYTFVRDIYLARRRAAVADGAPDINE